VMSAFALGPMARMGCVIGAAIAFGACNSLLDNRPGELAQDVSGNEPEDSGTVAPGAGRNDGAPPPTDGPGADARPPECPAGEKRCAGVCVSNKDVYFGCAGPTCEPCALPHATSSCSFAATADSAECGVARCNAGWADCNGMPMDGCETDLSLPTSCGGCAVVCAPAGRHATVSCINLACTTICEPERGDCNKDPTDGCEAKLLDDEQNCGGCGLVCPIGRCRQGACHFLF
jgi:hypothetical protein